MAARKARRRGRDAARAPEIPAAAPSSARPPPPPDPWRRAVHWAILAALLSATAAAYGPALHGEFHFDDWVAIQANMRLRGPEALRLPGLEELLLPSRAITRLTFALDYRAVGLVPFRYHVVSLIAHLAAGVLAFLLCRRLLSRAGHERAAALALVAAGAFLLHPIQTQAVAYAAQRSEVLASALYLLALLLLEDAAARWRTLRGSAAWAGGVGAWLLAMGTKSIAITVPAAFVLDEVVVAPAGERGAAALWRRARRALGIAAPVLGFAAWSIVLHLRAFAAVPQAGVGFESLALPPGRYWLTQLRVQWLYLRLLAWPDALALDRTIEPSQGLDSASALAGAGVLALLALATCLWVRAERGRGAAAAGRLAAFGIYWWFLVLAPSSSVIPVVDLVMEHRLYLASLGPILAAVVGANAALTALLRRRAARAGAAVAAALLLALGVALWGRAGVWATDESLWRDASAKFPGSARILTNLGLALQRKGDLDGAEAAYRRAWPLARRRLQVAQLSRNYAGLLEIRGRPAEALPILERGLSVAGEDADLLANRAVALTQLGRREEALAEARRAVAVAPSDPAIRNLFGEVLAYHQQWAEALGEFRLAASIDPGSPLYLANQVVPLAGVGRRDEACQLLRDVTSRFAAAQLPREVPRWKSMIGCSP
jgi:tetratricopeptide (TPR) repeat protein